MSIIQRPGEEFTTCSSFQAWEAFDVGHRENDKWVRVDMGHDSAIQRGGGENQIRVEARAVFAVLKVNGKQLSRIVNAEIAVDSTRLGLIFWITKQPDESAAEVRFKDFKVLPILEQ